MLSQVIDAEHPDHLAVAFDVKGGTFRNTMLPQYKGTRDAAPEDLLTQLPLIQRMLTALGVTFIEKPGYEGDDVIGTLASMGDKAGYRTLVLSGDRDAFQLINDNITVLYPGHHFKDLKHMTPTRWWRNTTSRRSNIRILPRFVAKPPTTSPAFPAWAMDSRPNGSTCMADLTRLSSMPTKSAAKKGEALRANIDQVKLNRSVNALVRDLDLGVSIEDLTFGQVDANQLNQLFTRLEFGIRTKNRVLRNSMRGSPPTIPCSKTSPASSKYLSMKRLTRRKHWKHGYETICRCRTGICMTT